MDHQEPDSVAAPPLKFLVPVDIDEPSVEAFRFAMKMSQQNDKLYLFHIHRKPPSVAPYFVEDGQQISSELTQNLRDSILKDCATANKTCYWIQKRTGGDVAHEICKFAEHEQVDQVVMGGRGLGAVGGIILGSVSQAVLKSCRCPVTVVKKPPTQ